jgi:hypothetical protein
MERQSCTHCGDPVTGTAITRAGWLDDEAFHSGCWAQVRTAEQRVYERLVRTVGLPALISPYIAPAPLPSPQRPELAHARLQQRWV